MARHRCDSIAFRVPYGIRALPFLIVLVACGDNAMPCDYAEHDDVANGTTSEMTAVDVTTHGVHVCGQLDGGHYDHLLRAVDDDAYRITVNVSGPVLVQIHGDDGVELFDDVTVRFFDTAPNPRLVAQGRFDPSHADHGAFIAYLDPGVYDMIVSGRAGELSGFLPYRIRLSPMPDCPQMKAPADYHEARDADNGAVAVDFSQDPSFSPVADAAPEDTRIAVVAGQRYLITGDVAATDPQAAYMDADTFAITTGDSPNELAIRLDWDGDSSDLDYVLFEAPAMTPMAASNYASTVVRELAMVAVKPRTTYWLWIGGFRGSRATAYRATVCGAHFFF